MSALPAPVLFRTPALRRLALLGASLLALGLSVFPTRAATLTATLDRDVIALGDTATLKVSIEGGNGQEAPRIPEVAGLQITAAGSGRSFTFENGRQTFTIENSYAVTARRIGEFRIGPVTVVAGGKTLSDGPLTLKVVKADDPSLAQKDALSRAAFLGLDTSKREVWVGEPLMVETRLYAIGGRLQQAPQLQADGFTLGKQLDPAQEGNFRTNNMIYSRIRFAQSVIPARAGDLAIQASDCIIDIPVSRRGGGGGGFFEDAFFNLRENRRFTLACEPVPVKVRPLPTAGVPPGFNGAIGDFDIALTASPTNLQAGDPVTLRIEISGRGNFDSVQLADSPQWSGFRVYPATGTFQTEDPLGLAGVKKFEQVVTPESASITEIPALTFSCFSPRTGSYQTLRTRPVPLRVAPGAATPTIPVPAGTTVASTTTNATPTLPPLKPHLGPIVAVASPVVFQPWFLGLAALPAILWSGFLAWERERRRRGADPEARRRADLERRVAEGLRALGELAGKPAAEPFFAALFRVLQEMVALPLGQPPASITEGVLDTDLPRRGVAPETIAALHRLFQACNQARYTRGGSPADREELRAAAAAAWAALNPPK